MLLGEGQSPSPNNTSPQSGPKSGTQVESVLSVLSAEKFLRAIFLFSCSLHLIDFPIVLYSFYLLLGACLIILPLQRPWKKPIEKKLYSKIGLYALIYLVNILSWLGSIKYYGPIRTILTTELADAALSSLFTKMMADSSVSKHKKRLQGLGLCAAAWLLLFFFAPAPHPDNNLLGAFCVVLTLASSAGTKALSKILFLQEKTFGGPKRLFAVSTPLVLAMLFPVALFQYFYAESSQGLFSMLLSPVYWLIVIFTVVGEFYIHNVIPASVELGDISQYSLASSFVGCIIGPMYWTGVDGISFASFLGFGLLLFGMHLIFAKKTKDLPLTGMNTAMRGISVFSTAFFKQVFRQIMSHRDSQRIFMFLCINLVFMFVEILYGIWTNSLGLISDACHMLFDNTALVIGLFASVISNWEPNTTFSYGYGRFETLSGFVNGIFLVFVAVMVLMESTERIYSPQPMNSDKLLLVSVLGLLVNLVGVVAFHDLHSHGDDDDEGGGDEHGHSHGHSHGGHSHGGHSHGHSHSHGSGSDSNVYGVYLHIIADTLGSVGVIISSVLIEMFDWTMADPICSFCISLMIFVSVIPLLKNSTETLLQATPTNLAPGLQDHLNKVLNLPGVITYSNPHFWKYAKSHVVGTLNVHVNPDVNEQEVLKKTRKIFKHAGVKNFTCQIVKK